MPIGQRSILKSHSNGRLIDVARGFLAQHSEAVVLAPTHSAGEELAHFSGGVAGVHRSTLVQFALDLARPAIADLKLAPLSALGLEALCARVAHAAQAAGELSYFGPVASLTGFARALARTLSELRLGGAAAQQIALAGAPGEDLARLLNRYEAELEQQSLADLARVFALAADAAGDPRSLHGGLGLPLLLLDAPLETAAHMDLFVRVAERASAVLAAISSGEEELEGRLGAACRNLDSQQSESSLEHLRTYLFSVAPAASVPDGALELFSAPGEGLEAVEIARRILRLAQEGTPFDQIAVLLRSPERYQPMIDDALRRARIPAYFSRGATRPDPGGRAFLALLACASEKCSASRFAEYLSLGQLPPAGAAVFKQWIGADDEMLPESETPLEQAAEIDETRVARAPASWEKLLVDAAVIGGRDRWRRRLRGLENEFELRLKTLDREDDPRAESLRRQLDQLRELEHFALPLIDQLDALPRSANWKDWIGQLSQLAGIALRRPEGVLSVLAEFEPMGDVGPVSLDEVKDVLSDRLRFLRREPPKRRYGCVFVGSIEESRGREFAVVFLPGLAEGLFPQRSFEDPLLLDEFRRELTASLALHEDRVKQERLRLALAVGAARQRLIASYPRMDVAESRPRVPSFYALELPRAIEGRLPELKEFEKRARDGAPARLNWPAPRETSEAIDDVEYDLVMLAGAIEKSNGARYLVEANPHLARSLRARYRRWAAKWKEPDGLISSHPDTLAALAKHRLTERPWSPSSLQQFALCPYRFALHGIYALRPREESAPIEQLDPLTRGALFHAVQFALLGHLKQRGWLPVNAANLEDALALADEVLDASDARFKEDLVPAIERVWKSEMEDLRTDLRGWLQHVAANDNDWEPIHFEFAFGLTRDEGRDPASTGKVADLSEYGVRLRGSIDLVERHVARGVVRVTDHKTGKPPEMIPAFVGGGKFLQPLLYALAAEKLLGATVESGRLFYATQQGGYQHAEIQASDRARKFLAKLLVDIDGAIAEGFLPPAPQKDACKTCDYRPVCGPYEETRTLKKDRHDERLDGLIEIRGMA
jgi:CRISPR/Cas system-associated exonuclease Cas4 (RecB family)